MKRKYSKKVLGEKKSDFRKNRTSDNHTLSRLFERHHGDTTAFRTVITTTRPPA